MQVTLPYTKHKVTLADYISEEIVAILDGILLSKQRMDDMSWERVTLDEIASALPDEYDKISKERDEERKKDMVSKAKKKVMLTDPKRGGISTADFKEAMRLRAAYMIEGVELHGEKDSKKTLDVANRDTVVAWVRKLPSVDVDFLRGKVDEIELQMDAFLANAGAESKASKAS